MPDTPRGGSLMAVSIILDQHQCGAVYAAMVYMEEVLKAVTRSDEIPLPDKVDAVRQLEVLRDSIEVMEQAMLDHVRDRP